MFNDHAEGDGVDGRIARVDTVEDVAERPAQLAVTFVATLVPARRASAVDPQVALRAE